MIATVRLVNFEGNAVPRGSVFRLPAKWPYESCVDFMVFETYLEDRPYGLMVTSGYKAGLTLVQLPGESVSVEGGIDRDWIVKNWAEWIYPQCDVSEVYLLNPYVSE